jgi:hypothetical protein
MSGNANAVARALVARIESRNGDALRDGLTSWIRVDRMRRDVAAARRVARGAETLFDRELDALVGRSPGLAVYRDWNGVVAARTALPGPSRSPRGVLQILGLIAFVLVAVAAGGVPELPATRWGWAALSLLPLTLALFLRYADGSWTPAALACLAAALVPLAVVGWLSWRHSA